MIDLRVRQAIVEATREMGQPEAVADRLAAWLEALSNGNTGFDQREETTKRCKDIYEAVRINEADLEDEDNA